MLSKYLARVARVSPGRWQAEFTGYQCGLTKLKGRANLRKFATIMAKDYSYRVYKYQTDLSSLCYSKLIRKNILKIVLDINKVFA